MPARAKIAAIKRAVASRNPNALGILLRRPTRVRGNLATLNKDGNSAVRLVSQSAASRRAMPNKVDLRSWAVFIDWSSMATARTISISWWSIMLFLLPSFPLV